MKKRAKQNLSHYRLFTGDLGQLIPIAVQEVLPGDTFRQTTTILARTPPLLTPVMHPVFLSVYHFYCPSRILWDEWDDLMTDKTTSAFPTITLSSPAAGDLSDHLGLPLFNGLTVSALPFRAYNLVWNEFFRDQRLDTAVSLDATTLNRVAWEKDYFTTATTEPQFGDPVLIPVDGVGLANTPAPGASASRVVRATDQETNPTWDSFLATDGTPAGGDARFIIREDPNKAGYPYIGVDPNAWRAAMAGTNLRERLNRFGDRLRDRYAAMGVRVKDERLQRPEYLGGGRAVVSFSEVLATTDDGASQPLGSLGGHGIATMGHQPYRRFFEEAGWVITLFCARPKTLYMNGVHRHWYREEMHDFWQPEDEMLGPQEVMIKEVYGGHGNGTEGFGWQARHQDYRSHPSTVSGGFREAPDYDWHLARAFSTDPTLNANFVRCSPADRIFADTSQPELYCMAQHRVAAMRLVSKYARH